MKKLILTSLVATTATVGALAQGTIAADNLNNSSSSLSAASGGLFFSSGTLYSGPLNITILGGASASSLSPVTTLLSSDFANAGAGLYFDLSGQGYPVPGVALNGNATLEIEAWTGNFSTYAAASAFGAGDSIATVTFQNATGGGSVGGAPPNLPVDLVGMPAVNLLPVTTPEPSTIALGGLGAAALLLFRRRK
jgi:hypothetical protein